jgi:cyclase
MLKHRVIPCLLLSNSGIVKTKNFKQPKYIGDPINAFKIFNDKEVDEIMLLDIDVTKNKKKINYNIIERIASECFMPLTYGGGIQNIDEAKILFSLGVEKICIQTSAFNNTKILNNLVQIYGSSSIIASLDIKKNWLGKYKIFSYAENKILDLNIENHIKELVDIHGVGEILLTSVDNEGTMLGPDLNLIKLVSNYIDVPLIINGGISCLNDIKMAILNGADAVACGSFFVFQGPHKAVLLTYPKYKDLENLFNHDM